MSYVNPCNLSTITPKLSIHIIYMYATLVWKTLVIWAQPSVDKSHICTQKSKDFQIYLRNDSHRHNLSNRNHSSHIDDWPFTNAQLLLLFSQPGFCRISTSTKKKEKIFALAPMVIHNSVHVDIWIFSVALLRPYVHFLSQNLDCDKNKSWTSEKKKKKKKLTRSIHR